MSAKVVSPIFLQTNVLHARSTGVASRRDLAVDDFREYEGAAGDHRVVELAVGDLRAVKCAAASFMQAKALPETLMLSNVLLATLVQSTVRSRAGPLCCPHCLPLGG